MIIPAKPKYAPELKIRLKTIDIGDHLLEQLRQVINDMVNTSQFMDVFVRAADGKEELRNEMSKTAILSIEHDKLKTFQSIEELKKEIERW